MQTTKASASYAGSESKNAWTEVIQAFASFALLGRSAVDVDADARAMELDPAAAVETSVAVEVSVAVE
jgi:hypothetical protein